MKIILVMMMMSLVSAHEEHHLKCGTNEDEFVPNNPLDEHEDIRRALGTNPHPKRHVRHADSGAQAYQRFHRNLGTSTAIISVAFHAIRDFPCEDGNFCNCTNISLTEQDSGTAEYLTYTQAIDEINNLNSAYNNTERHSHTPLEFFLQIFLLSFSPSPSSCHHKAPFWPFLYDA